MKTFQNQSNNMEIKVFFFLKKRGGGGGWFLCRIRELRGTQRKRKKYLYTEERF